MLQRLHPQTRNTVAHATPSESHLLGGTLLPADHV